MMFGIFPLKNRVSYSNFQFIDLIKVQNRAAMQTWTSLPFVASYICFLWAVSQIKSPGYFFLNIINCVLHYIMIIVKRFYCLILLTMMSNNVRLNTNMSNIIRHKGFNPCFVPPAWRKNGEFYGTIQIR